MAISDAFERQPLYAQVSDLLAGRIARREWKPGQSIPSEIELARELAVSIGTLRKALDKLEADHLLVRRQGRGTFVMDDASQEMLQHFNRLRSAEGHLLNGGVQVLEQIETVADEDEHRRLQLAPGDSLLRTLRLWMSGDRPIMLEDARLALRRFPAVEANSVSGDYEVLTLARRYGVHLVSASERLSMTRATSDTGDALGVAPGTSLLRLDRVFYTLHDVPVEWRVGLCNLREEYYQVDIR